MNLHNMLILQRIAALSPDETNSSASVRQSCPVARVFAQAVMVSSMEDSGLDLTS